MRSGKRLRQAFVKNVDDALRRFDIAAAYRGGRTRIHDRAFGRDDLERPHAAGIRWNRKTDQRAEYVENSRCRDGVHGVDAAFGLRIGSGKIDRRALAFNRDLHADRDRLVGDSVVVEKVFGFVGPVGNRSDRVPRHAFAVVENFRNVAAGPSASRISPRSPSTGVRLCGSRRSSRPDRLRVPSGVRTLARIMSQTSRLILPFDIRLDGRDAQTFLIDLLRKRHRTRRHATDIGLMRAACDVEQQLLFRKHAGDERDVGKMRSAFVRIVQDDRCRRARCARLSIAALTDSGIEPRCTGM